MFSDSTFQVTKISYPARITSAKVLIELEEYDVSIGIGTTTWYDTEYQYRLEKSTIL